jgi:hypothetical protein
MGAALTYVLWFGLFPLFRLAGWASSNALASQC